MKKGVDWLSKSETLLSTTGGWEELFSAGAWWRHQPGLRRH